LFVLSVTHVSLDMSITVYNLYIIYYNIHPI